MDILFYGLKEDIRSIKATRQSLYEALLLVDALANMDSLRRTGEKATEHC